MTCSSDNRRRSAGVTLLEMLVVLSIISVAAVIFAATTMSAATRGQTARQAEMLASAIRAARADAVAAGQEIEMTFHTADGAYGVNERTVVRLPPGLSISFTGAAEIFDETGAGVLRIYADGSTSGALIKISSERETDSIAVDWLTGAVRLSRERRR